MRNTSLTDIVRPEGALIWHNCSTGRCLSIRLATETDTEYDFVFAFNLLLIWICFASDEFTQYAKRKSEYAHVFRRRREEDKKAATKLQVCDYNNANYKTKTEWSIITRCVYWAQLFKQN